MNLKNRAERFYTLIIPSLGSALLLALAMPGYFGWSPLLFVALVPLLLIVLTSSPRRSALAGFTCGLFFFLMLLYWILIVLGRYGGLPLWLSFPALLLLSAYMAGYVALFAFLLSVLAGRYWHKERSLASFVWLAPILWVGLDYLRSIVLSGFPWMDLGYGLFDQPKLIQAADLGGHSLITFSLVLCNSLVVGIIDRQRRAVRWNIKAERRWLLAACIVLVFVFGYSTVRYQVVKVIASRSLQAQVTVVQGNIDQSVKWSPEIRAATVDRYVSLSRQGYATMDAELVVWPETALPFYPQQDPLTNRVTAFVQQDNVWLLTGAPLYSVSKEGNDKGQVQYFNGALLFNPAGAIAGTHAKQHLVPFGEYVPMRRFLPFLAPLVESVGDFTPGTETAPLKMGALRLGLLICYESIFPDIARESVKNGANLLVNITNDAWYGRSSAPYQSMAMAVFRAVETKRSLIRAANTGISGFVDPLGNVVRQTPLFTATAVTEHVPMLELETVFCRWGYLFAPCCSVLIPLLLLLRRKRED